MRAAETYQKDLSKIKSNVEESYKYFKPNFDRFHDFRKFVFKTNLTDEDISVLTDTNKPQIEFNVCESYLSRLRGEWSKQQPSISVRAADGEKIDPEQLNNIEGHMRSILHDANNNSMEYDVYTDILSGGFSAIKVFTEYSNPMSFDQAIKMRRCYDPTLTGFDPMAIDSHKGDGNYCFELYPKRKEELEEMGIDVSSLQFARTDFQGFNWCYRNEKMDIVLLCDYYTKKKKRVKIYHLANNKTVKADDYNDYIKQWFEAGHIEQPAKIINERYTDIETICRYRLIQDKVIEYVETNYKYLPIIFVDGNSILIKDSTAGAVQQMTRPYIYHAKGVQKLKNFAGQCLANELENMVQHKWMFPEEGISDSYKDAITNNQIPNIVVYKAYKDNDPEKPLPAPREIQRIPAPPEVTNTFTLTDNLMQMVLGSYDASLGVNDNQLSGVAIVESATQSNATSMPYVVGFMQALNQGAQIIVDLIPKYIVTPRTIPVVGIDGKKSYVKVNHPGASKLNYQSTSLEVKVEAGVNFAIQKTRAFNQMIALQKVSPQFAQFMAEKGLSVLLDNMDFRGIDQLKVMADEWMKEMKMRQAQAQGQPNPVQAKLQIDQAKVQNEQMEIQAKTKKGEAEVQIDAGRLKVEQQEADTDRLKVIAALTQANDQNLIDTERLQTEKTGQAVDLAIKTADHIRSHARDDSSLVHTHLKDKAELAHELIKTVQQPTGENTNG
jgi:hypothetical protein